MKVFKSFLFVFILLNVARAETPSPPAEEIYDVLETETTSANIPYPQRGDLIFSEVMVSPSLGPEWIEIYNTKKEAKKLTGCGLKDLGVTHHSHIIQGNEIVIEPYGYLFLSGGNFPSDCKIESDYQYKSINLIDNGIEELVLACPGTPKESDEVISFDDTDMILIDKIVFDLSIMKIKNGYSMTLCPDFLNEKDNDNINNWAGAMDEDNYCNVLGKKEFGTPKKPNKCLPKPPEKVYPEKNELVITEIMISPNDGPEWFEFYNPTINTFDLVGCKIEEGKETLHNDEIKSQTSIKIGPKEYFLFSTTQLCDNCPSVDYKYKTEIGFNDKDEEYLKIMCPQKDGAPPDVVIDEILYNKGNVSSTKKGYSWSLLFDKLDAVLNDNTENWCSAREEDFYIVGENIKNYGTPKFPNQCPQPPIPPKYPAEGEVIISEIMISPDGGAPEWFEIYNLSDKEFDLWGCKLMEGGKLKKNEHVISTQSKLKIPPKSYRVLAKKYCIEGEACNLTSYIYSSLTFNTSDEEELSISCPDETGKNEILIDKIKYNWGNKASTTKGYSYSLKPEKFNAKDNDLKENFCSANKVDIYPSVVEVPNYGTPGFDNRCSGIVEVEKVEEIECAEPPCKPAETKGEGCFCNIGKGRGSFQWFGVFLVFLFSIIFSLKFNRTSNNQSNELE